MLISVALSTFCSVSHTFAPGTNGWNNTAFATINSAIHKCTILSDPVPIRIMTPAGNSSVIHREDVIFNSSVRGVNLYGTNFMSTFLAGHHVVAPNQVGRVTLSDLTLLADALVLPRNTPIVTAHSSGLTDLELINVHVSTGELAGEYSGSVLSAYMIDGSSTVRLTLMRVRGKVVGSVSAPLFDIRVPNGTVIVDRVLTEKSVGSALVAGIVGSLTITDSSFEQCLVTETTPPESCVNITVHSTGQAVMIRNKITRTNAAVDGILPTNRFTTGLWLDWPLTVDDDVALGPLDAVRGWVMTDNIGVGIRLTAISFTPQFLALLPSIQKEYVRGVSMNNLGIGKTEFYDVVIGTVDDSSTVAVERLWCSDGCTRTFTANVFFVYVIVGLSVSLLLLCCVCVFVGPIIIPSMSNELKATVVAQSMRSRKSL